MNDDKKLDLRRAFSYMTIFALAAALGIVLYIYYTGSGALTSQQKPVVAYLDKDSTNKGIYLSVWTDQRDGNNDIVGAIIDPQGTTVKSNFPLTVANATQTLPAVAANKTNKEFLAVWQDQRNGPPRDIYGQLVRHDSKLVGKNFPVSTASNDQTDVAVAYDSKMNHYLVVWQDYRNTNTTLTDIYGQIISHDGTPKGKNFVISNHPANSYEPSVAYNSTDDEFLVVWQDDRSTTATVFNIYGQRLSGVGQTLGNEIPISAVPTYQSHPEVAYDASNKTYLVVWQDNRNFATAKEDIYGQRLKNTGALDGGNFPISTAKGFQGGSLSVASEPQNFLVIFDDTRNMPTTKLDIYGQRVSPSGQLKGNNFPISNHSADQSWNSVAYAAKDSSYLVVWQDWRNLNTTSTDIYGQHVAIDGTLLQTASNVNFLISVPKVSGQLKP